MISVTCATPRPPARRTPPEWRELQSFSGDLLERFFDSVVIYFGC